MMYKHLFLATGLMLLPQLAAARPVSYPGGWTVMQMNNDESSSLHIHYSPTATYSIGYKGELDHTNNVTMHTLQVNNLLKRWNKPGSQANVYLKSGIGAAELDGDWEPAAYTGFATDWETRNLFASYENRLLWQDTLNRAFSQRARVGFAPVVRAYNEWQPWLMLEVSHHPQNERGNTTVTPLVRFFKQTWLIEAGYALRQDKLMFNWIKRF